VLNYNLVKTLEKEENNERRKTMNREEWKKILIFLWIVFGVALFISVIAVFVGVRIIWWVFVFGIITGCVLFAIGTVRNKLAYMDFEDALEEPDEPDEPEPEKPDPAPNELVDTQSDPPETFK